MMKTIIHSSENGNYYIYDDQTRLSILIHPEIKDAHENIGEISSYYLKNTRI